MNEHEEKKNKDKEKCSMEEWMELPGKMPEHFYLGAAAGSIILSIGLFARNQKKDAIFVGLWAPTFLALGTYAKLMGPAED